MQGLFAFDTWLNGPLLPILQATRSGDLGERVIQARAVWLVGQVAEQISRESRLAIYPLIVRLMSCTNYDRVITLTASKVVKQLVNDVHFLEEDFAPHLRKCIVSCFQLIACSEDIEAKRDVLSTV